MREPTKKDALVLKLIFAGLILIVLSIPFLVPTGRSIQRDFNWGFSPDMECQNPSGLEPMCFRRR
jgi:hypothetical protein